MNICKKLCGECPFSKQSLSGWLATYSVDDFKKMMEAEIMFPCHKTMSGGDITVEEAQQFIKNGKMKMCRGYLESMIKSAKMPKFNKELIEYREVVKAEGLSEQSMSIHEFVTYHTKPIVKKFSLRTEDEINIQIEGLKRDREKLPRYSMFHTPNWDIIDQQIRILQGVDSIDDVQEDEELLEEGDSDEVYQGAMRANDWLKKDIDENLFDE